MKHYFCNKILLASVFVGLLLSLAGCGQKGPLIVEEPSIEEPRLQDEELAPVK